MPSMLYRLEGWPASHWLCGGYCAAIHGVQVASITFQLMVSHLPIARKASDGFNNEPVLYRCFFRDESDS